MSKARLIRRDDVIDAFRPMLPLMQEIIATARAATTPEKVKAANPDVTRDSLRSRIAGLKRWGLVADGLVAAGPRMPAGFSVVSTDHQHNGGQYVFRFPGGVFTVRQAPHQDPDEGTYLQERLEEILAVAPLAEGIDGAADMRVYLSVPARREARLIVTHTTLGEPMIITLSEIAARPLVAPSPARRPTRRRVRSKLVPDVVPAPQLDQPS